MNAQIQTDREILRDLIAKYNTKNSFIPEEAAEKLIFLTVCEHGNFSTWPFDWLVDRLIRLDYLRIKYITSVSCIEAVCIKRPVFFFRIWSTMSIRLIMPSIFLRWEDWIYSKQVCDCTPCLGSIDWLIAVKQILILTPLFPQISPQRFIPVRGLHPQWSSPCHRIFRAKQPQSPNLTTGKWSSSCLHPFRLSPGQNFKSFHNGWDFTKASSLRSVGHAAKFPRGTAAIRRAGRCQRAGGNFADGPTAGEIAGKSRHPRGGSSERTSTYRNYCIDFVFNVIESSKMNLTCTLLMVQSNVDCFIHWECFWLLDWLIKHAFGRSIDWLMLLHLIELRIIIAFDWWINEWILDIELSIDFCVFLLYQVDTRKASEDPDTIDRGIQQERLRQYDATLLEAALLEQWPALLTDLLREWRLGHETTNQPISDIDFDLPMGTLRLIALFPVSHSKSAELKAEVTNLLSVFRERNEPLDGADFEEIPSLCQKILD